MDGQRISPDSSVADILRLAPRVQAVFVAHRTACVGCSLARFCSLRDVAVTYELALETWLQELERAAHAESQITQRSHP